jgi:alpha-tubulin suppressor-like RCC1 family protein
MAVGGNFTVFILNNGNISGWGNNNYRQALGGINLTGQCPF